MEAAAIRVVGAVVASLGVVEVPVAEAALGDLQAVVPVPVCPAPALAPVPAEAGLAARRRSGIHVPLAGLKQHSPVFR